MIKTRLFLAMRAALAAGLVCTGVVAAYRVPAGPVEADAVPEVNAGSSAQGAAAVSGKLLLTPPIGSHAPGQLVAAQAPSDPVSQRHAYGLLLDGSSGHGGAQGARTSPTSTPTTTSLSASVDLSAYDPPVGNQGSVNSCVSWATGYTLLGWYANRYNNAGSPYAPMYVYSQVTGGQNVGTTFDANMSLEVQQGIDTQADYTQGNYDYVDQPTTAEHANAATYKANGYNYLSGGGPTAQSIIENALASGHPVTVGIPVYANFENATASSPFVDVPPPGSPLYGYHAITGVKYDGYGLWIENQWGTGWGLNGYAELSWAFVNQDLVAVYEFTGFTAPPLAGSTPTPNGTLPPVSTPTTGPTSTLGPSSTPSSTNTPAATATPAPLMITLQPNSGSPGTIMTVWGQGFHVPESFTVYWNGRAVYTDAVRTDGTFYYTMVIDRHSKPGVYIVLVKGSSGDSASAPFTVL